LSDGEGTTLDNAIIVYLSDSAEVHPGLEFLVCTRCTPALQ